MKRWFLVFLLVLCSFGVALAEDSGARFSSISGQVEIRPEVEAKSWKSAIMEATLNVDDHIKTGEDSSAIIGFADMSTFLLKDESEIIISTPPSKDSKVKLVCGKIWVNVKKMVKDGEMSIEMSQAVAGIKGTNITGQTNPEGTEDRIQVLRGLAEILIKETREIIMLQEGEELIVKAGGKTEKIEINIQAETDKWQKELSKMGDSIQMNEVPETIRNLMQKESESFKDVQNQFKSLVSSGNYSGDAAKAFSKDAERFSGVIMEDGFILASILAKVDQAISTGSNTAVLVGYQKQVADARKVHAGYQAELAKMIKEVTRPRKETGTPEIDQLTTEVTQSWNIVDSLVRELSSNPNGMSQDWFVDAQGKCTDALKQLGDQSTRVQSLIDSNPGNSDAQALLKQISGYTNQTNTLMRGLSVVPVESADLTAMSETEFAMSDSILKLRDLINQYNTTYAAAPKGQDEVRLRATLSILNDYGRTKRLYLSAQRRYDSIMKAAAGQKYRTSEQTELMETFDRISNTFQQLGAAADELSTRLQDLESQLGRFLTK
ncbi:MAG: FecR domain-containing protein [Candidatus Ozemobacteraceae bacterium]